MKKTLAMLLVFVMLFSLCACGNDETKTTNPSDSSQSTTNSTENTTGNTECSHTWADATCTAAKTCSICGETEGEAIGHTWADANCTAPKTCSVCGETEGEAIGHTWADATCTAPKTCSVCGATEGEATGHTWADATCTAPKTCSKCGATEGSASGHSWSNATCTAAKTCSKCGATEGSTVEHSLTAVCTMCGKTNEEYRDFNDGEWRYVPNTDDGFITVDIMMCDIGHEFQDVWYSFPVVNITHTKYQIYTVWEQEALAQGLDVEIERKYGLICTIDGVEYMATTADFDQWVDYTYTYENGVYTIKSGDNAIEITRTGFAELIVTGGNYLEIGQKLIAN